MTRNDDDGQAHGGGTTRTTTRSHPGRRAYLGQPPRRSYTPSQEPAITPPGYDTSRGPEERDPEDPGSDSCDPNAGYPPGREVYYDFADPPYYGEEPEEEPKPDPNALSKWELKAMMRRAPSSGTPPDTPPRLHHPRQALTAAQDSSPYTPLSSCWQT